MKESWTAKLLAVSVIFLFIGVAIVPNVNPSVVKASGIILLFIGT